MSYLDSLRVVGELERDFDVNALRYEGICVWPIIRNALTASLENENNKTFRDPRNGKYDLWALIPDPAQLETLDQYSGVDYLFWTRAAEYRTKIQGRYYGFSDPYLEIVKDSNRVLKVELNTGHVQGTMPRYFPTLFIKHTTVRIPCPIGKNDIENFQDLRQRVLSLCPIDMDEGIVLEILHYTEQHRLLFLDVLRRIRPKVVSMVCYYTCSTAMGLIGACRDLGITTVELKHGVIPNGPYYDRWTRIPEGGYEYLPDWFYVWSDRFRRDIEALQPAGCRHHRAVVGPNEWMRKVIQEPLPPIDGVDPSFLSDLKRRSKVILISLQSPTDEIPSHVLETMRVAPKNWIWLLRCHPRFKQQDQLTATMSRNGISNYEIEKATDNPLFLLLACSHAHLTSYSSTCFEAMLLGVPSLLYTRAGYEYFGDYIEQGFLWCEYESSENLLRWLNTHHDPAIIRKQGETFVTMDQGAGRRAFETLLGHAEGQQARPLNKRYRAANLNQMGRYHIYHGDLSAAIEAFSAAIQYEPVDTEAYNNLGGLCWRLGDRRQAQRFIESAMEIDPSDLRTLRNWNQLQSESSVAAAIQPTDIAESIQGSVFNKKGRIP